MTDILNYYIIRDEIYHPIFPELMELFSLTGHNRMIDLGSGGGGALLSFMQYMKKEQRNISITATDIYPNIDAFHRLKRLSDGYIDFHPKQVDATRLPHELAGVRTLFSVFHHFSPKIACRILQDAVNSQSPIALFEFTERTSYRIWQMFPATFILFRDTPYIHPFKWSRLFWTYLIPVMPLMYCWDGIVSQLRTYTVEELKRMVDEIQGESFYWKFGKAEYISYLIGYPKLHCAE